MFDVTVYTEVTKADSLDGRGGFNFRAASSGATEADRKEIESYALHSVQSGWHLRHDPLLHPPSCIYRKSGGKFIMSRGKSIGKTLANDRHGNQLTQTILTADRGDFLPYRPAQLFAASKWKLDNPQGKVLDPWPTPLEIDPRFEAESLKQMVLGNRDMGAGFLPAFLTMIEQTASSATNKLIIVHTDLDEVMRYIALGSLFVDTNRALDLTFYAFTDDPLSANADIVGATTDFGPTPDVWTGGIAYNVVDLLQGEMSPVEVSESAAQQAKWFLDGDPDDALAAIDVARRWEVVLDADIATRAAGIVSFATAGADAQGRRAALRAVAGLAGSELSDELVMYADEFLDAIVETSPADERDIQLAAAAIDAAHRAGLDDIATGILLPTLEGLDTQPALVSAWAAASAEWPDSSPIQWDSDESRDHALVAQVAIARRAQPSELPAVLIAARKCALLADADVMAQCLDRLAAYWCQHPELTERRGELPYLPQVGARLRNKLVSALEQGEDWAVSALTAGVWDWLGDSSRSAIAGWIAAATAGRIPLDRRAAEFAARGATLPTASWHIALAGAEIPADVTVVAKWVIGHPQIPGDLGAWIAEGLLKSRSKASDGVAARTLIDSVLDSRATTPNRELRVLLDDMDTALRAFDDAYAHCARERNPALPDFAARAAPYVAFLIREVGGLLVKARDERGAGRLEQVAGRFSGYCINFALDELANEVDDTAAVVWALDLYESSHDWRHEAGRDYLVALADTREGRQRLEAARGGLHSDWLPVLDGLVDDAKKGRLTRNLVRGGKRLFRKEQ